MLSEDKVFEMSDGVSQGIPIKYYASEVEMYETLVLYQKAVAELRVLVMRNANGTLAPSDFAQGLEVLTQIQRVQ